MKRLASLAFAFAGLFAVPALAETENKERYGGNCSVATERDDFTDEITHHWLRCINFNFFTPEVGASDFMLFCGRLPGYGVVLRTESQFHPSGDSVSVRYRWGKEKAQSENWEWKGDATIAAATTRNADTFSRFVEGMVTTNRLIFQVGTEKGSVKVTETERLAIPDFKARCGKE